jgi:signal peptidase II
MARSSSQPPAATSTTDRDAPGGAPRAALFWGLFVAVLALDVVTKLWAERTLVPQRVPHDVIGEWVRLTLVYNPGAAFGLYLGRFSRWIFTVLTLGALGILGYLYRTTRSGAWLRITAISLLCGGAVGNLIDRLRSSNGVVDFLDLGFGDHRWPTFNVADMAVSSGAFMLAWVLWGEDREAALAAERAAAQQGTNVSGGGAAASVAALTPAGGETRIP